MRRVWPPPIVQDPATTIRILREQLNAANEDVRQTQRRMIAALYWRAGALLAHADDNACGWDDVDAAKRGYWQRQSDALATAARAMESAL